MSQNSKKSTWTWITRFVFLVCISVLTACGGGGGSSPTPPDNTSVLLYTKVTGLMSPGLVLQNNVRDVLVVNADGLYFFNSPFNHGAAYKVDINSVPEGHICTPQDDTGTVGANPPVVNVVCSATSAGLSIGGTVQGLQQGSHVTLTNNNTDSVTVTGNASNSVGFTFKNKVALNGSYSVAVTAQPTNPAQICTVVNSSEQNLTSDVTDISVICSSQAAGFTIGGTVSGMEPGAQVTLLNNGADPVIVKADSNGNGSYTFAMPVPEHGSYLITVGGQPALPLPNGQICSPVSTNYALSDVTSNITNVAFTCSTQRYSISGTLTNLSPNSEITLYNNGTDSQTIKANGTFTFATQVASGGIYNVSIAELPFLQSCTVINGSGGVANKNVTTVQLNCNLPVLETIADLNNDGSQPTSRLVKGSDGNLYGTTQYGANRTRGSIFMIQPQGTKLIFKNLANFGSADGIEPSTPYAGLIQGSDGNFYGTTMAGGTLGLGTVFMFKPGESVVRTLYSFGGNNSGSVPYAELLEGSDGKLYGTTSAGGANDYGTIFRITVNKESNLGTFEKLHDFTGSNTDGGQAIAGLIQVADNLFYGTTRFGGASGNGTIYTLSFINTKAVVKVVYSFTGSDGQNPWADLVVGSDGNLYGTTSKGGTANVGTVFKLNPNNNGLTTLYSFKNGDDGSTPYARLVEGSDGNFYGTTTMAGGIFGALFNITPAGKLNPIFKFGFGAYPNAGLTLGSDGNLYGTTQGGGSFGFGAVFKYGSNL